MKCSFVYVVLCCLVFLSCSESKTKQSATVGTTKILVDDSFAPIIEDQYIVFDSSYPRAKIDLVYKPEIQLLNLLLTDSIDVAIMSRKLLAHEARFYESRDVIIRTNHIATDAIALITRQPASDSTITIDEIKAIMRGKSSKSLVFDNPSSSTVRYLKELAEIKNLPARGVYALSSNAEVIKYVHNNPGTIGVIGYNWIKQPTKELEPIVEKLKIMSVKNSPGLAGSDQFYEPTQNNIALGLYPLCRELYIINCQGGSGVGTGFAAFLASERGQRIMLKAGLLPDSIPTREVIIR
ncbi:substrate-binding domain-containing protein [Pedobacter sp. P351]|uniref:PstS family phosphate ABC transporter substrate-binding protein n=1 Tax=Pedobacter superstes TaxID=3133441 RepID=UPI0030A78443